MRAHPAEMECHRSSARETGAGTGLDAPFTTSFRAMACPCQVHLFADDPRQARAAADAAQTEVLRIERKYTRYRDDSVTARINASAGHPDGVEVDPETASLLDYAQTAWEQSDGLFDITSGVLREVWDFRSQKLPADDDVARVLERVGWSKLSWQRPRLRMPAGMQIDLGGYGKEYAADRAAQKCREHGIESGLVDLGGDIRIIGPHPKNGGWRVGIRDPRSPQTAIGTIPLERGAIATSGSYQRYMTIGGRRYAHLLDPRSGWPVEGLASVSVVAEHCLIAGTASTIAMLMGREGPRWLASTGLANLTVDAAGRVGGSFAGPGAAKAALQGNTVVLAKGRKGGAAASAVSGDSTST